MRAVKLRMKSGASAPHLDREFPRAGDLGGDRDLAEPAQGAVDGGEVSCRPRLWPLLA